MPTYDFDEYYENISKKLWLVNICDYYTLESYVLQNSVEEQQLELSKKQKCDIYLIWLKKTIDKMRSTKTRVYYVSFKWWKLEKNELPDDHFV